MLFVKKKKKRNRNKPEQFAFLSNASLSVNTVNTRVIMLLLYCRLDDRQVSGRWVTNGRKAMGKSQSGKE